MDFGRRDNDRPGFVSYSSEVTDNSSETMLKFAERVQSWTDQAGLKLGEGRTSVLPAFESGFVLYMNAPIEGGLSAWEDLAGKSWVYAVTADGIILASSTG